MDVTVASTTNVTASGVTGTLDVTGGATQTITTAGGATTLSGSVGTISATNTDMSADLIVTDGTDVSVTVTKSDAVGKIIVGDIDNAATNDATKQASGTVTVTATNDTTAATANADLDADMSAIFVDGGTTVTVSQSASATDELTNTTGGTVNQGAVQVTAGEDTTEVTVTQDASITENPAVEAIAAISETKTLTFAALAANETTIVDGLTFTAAVDLTAEEVAAAFANLSASDTQDAGGKVANGIYTGNISANRTSAAASGTTVVFTEVVAGASPALGVAAGDIDPTVVTSDTNNAATDAEDGILGITTNTVKILDTAATASITTVTVDGYKTGSSIGVDGAGVTQKANALTTLSLANSDANAAFEVATAATELDLTVNNVDGTLTLDHNGNATVDGDKTVATLDITTATADSDIALQADAVTDLTVSGSNELDLTASSLDALENVIVSGTAGLVLAGTDAAVLISVDASATSGDVSATIDADVAAADADADTAYLGGSGVDTVTLSTATDIDSKIDLAAGNDTLTLVDDTTAATVAVDGGAGDADTLSINTNGAAATLSTANITGFERLLINDTLDVNGGVTIDLDALGFTYVTTTGTDSSATTADDILLLDNMATGGTVVLTTAQGATQASFMQVAVTDADTTDTTLNIVAQTSIADLDVGTLTVADVTTININANDTVEDDNDNDDLTDDVLDISTLDLDATSAETITITGNGAINLDNTGNISVTVINASALEGSLEVTAAGTVASTITGGVANDTLTASDAGDTLIGGAGADTLTSGDLATLTGGDGADTFVIAVPTSVITFATITDLSSGDVINFTDAATFVSGAVNYAAEATFSDVVDTVVNTLVTDGEDIGWFQYDTAGETNTFIVESGAGDATAGFIAGEDSIIKIAGAVDLSTASYNLADGTLEIA